MTVGVLALNDDDGGGDAAAYSDIGDVGRVPMVQLQRGSLSFMNLWVWHRTLADTG